MQELHCHQNEYDRVDGAVSSVLLREVISRSIPGHTTNSKALVRTQPLFTVQF